MGPLLIVPLPGQVGSGSIHCSDQPFCRALSGTVSHGLWVSQAAEVAGSLEPRRATPVTQAG